MSGNYSRNKGYRFEAEFVGYMLAGGVPAKRHFMSGMYVKGDCTLSPDRHPPLRGELKRRKCLPTWLTTALGSHDFVAMREDRGETFILMRASRFRDLLASCDEHPQGEDPKGLSGEAMPARSREAGDAQNSLVSTPCVGRRG